MVVGSGTPYFLLLTPYFLLLTSYFLLLTPYFLLLAAKYGVEHLLGGEADVGEHLAGVGGEDVVGVLVDELGVGLAGEVVLLAVLVGLPFEEEATGDVVVAGVLCDEGVEFWR